MNIEKCSLIEGFNEDKSFEICLVSSIINYIKFREHTEDAFLDETKFNINFDNASFNITIERVQNNKEC